MQTAIWGCRHCGDIYEGSTIKGHKDNDKCPHCGLLQSKSYEEQIK
jgi:rubrerythrin